MPPSGGEAIELPLLRLEHWVLSRFARPHWEGRMGFPTQGRYAEPGGRSLRVISTRESPCQTLHRLAGIAGNRTRSANHGSLCMPAHRSGAGRLAAGAAGSADRRTLRRDGHGPAHDDDRPLPGALQHRPAARRHAFTVGPLAVSASRRLSCRCASNHHFLRRIPDSAIAGARRLTSRIRLKQPLEDLTHRDHGPSALLCARRLFGHSSRMSHA
jgi:hypothetical protein